MNLLARRGGDYPPCLLVLEAGRVMAYGSDIAVNLGDVVRSLSAGRENRNVW